mmetsp:Transcript_27729/g.38991  ORF Transcript_27729/g.38991 Transcript_27729/m.38991 type:complete len:154 (-) Transcript_27729:327-788(-)
MTINRRDTDLHKILDEQMVMFRQNIEKMDEANIDFRLNWNWTQESLHVTIDPFRIKQIIANLLNNAIEFTEEGFIELGIEEVEGAVRLYVKDTGIGISIDKQEIIFNRFMQGHMSKSRLYGGIGVELAILKTLSGLLGGEIGVISTPGEGSEF